MSLVTPYIENLKRIERDLEQEAVNIIKGNLDYVLWLIQDNQLSKGLTSSGKVAGYYAPKTSKYADDPHNRPRKDKLAHQPYNFEWTGSLFDKMFVKSEKDGFSIFSRDGKLAMLERQYGRLLKLTKENNHLINEELIKPKLYEYILKNMFRIN